MSVSGARHPWPARRWLVAVGVALGLVAAGARAQDAQLASSPAQRCLSPAPDDRVKPVYPPRLYEAKFDATVEAEFEFTAPDRAPRVTVEGGPRREIAESIEDYAAQLRVPCMSADGPPVRLRQTFAFVPNDGRKVVAWTQLVDADNPRRAEQLKCLVRPERSTIVYPPGKQRELREANVLLRVRFSDPAAPPTYDVVWNGGDRAFAAAVVPFVQMLRLPCLSGGPIEQDWRFMFRIDGGGNFKQHVLQDVSLQTFLGSVKPIKPGSAFFDTSTMKCPFDVRLVFRQPIEQNEIQELEEDVPARHAFLGWLGEREFALDPGTAGELYSQSMIIHVPCVKIDL